MKSGTTVLPWILKPTSYFRAFMKKLIAILGSTGSIGKQALEVIQQFPDLFEAEVLTAFQNVDLLIQQARQFSPNAVVIANEVFYPRLKEALADTDIKVYAGAKAIEELMSMSSIDMVLSAMVGSAGLLPTLAAIRNHKAIALANKETLVVAGSLVMQSAIENQVPILPVDSEHSAIFQCLMGESANPVHKIILTASGGPFRTSTPEEIQKANLAQALKHPRWNMGAKISVDSATLMNKGFEVIEARWLFGVTPQQIEVCVHPESVIHSMVEFEDGAIKAQLGTPDMKLPIAYAFGLTKRLKDVSPRLSFRDYPELHFEAPDFNKFPCLRMAYEALERGGNAPCIINAANEIAVQAFLDQKISFTRIAETLEHCITKATFLTDPGIEDLLVSDREVRQIAKNVLSL